MALFGNSKKKENSGAPKAPPAPPAPPGPPGVPPSPSGIPAPPKSDSPSPQSTKENLNEDSLNSVSKLSSPPVPGGSLNSIKEEVSSASRYSENSNMDSNNRNMVPSNSKNDDSDDSEDLFDFSDLDIPDVNSSQEIESHVDKQKDDYFDEPDNSDDSLNFVSNRNSLGKHKPEDTFFVTTAQFKSLLEIVDSVKLKVKDSSERHLRLLDIKSEEDVEYENLRKDFQFIEDKLYEVDSLIFEK